MFLPVSSLLNKMARFVQFIELSWKESDFCKVYFLFWLDSSIWRSIGMFKVYENYSSFSFSRSFYDSFYFKSDKNLINFVEVTFGTPSLIESSNLFDSSLNSWVELDNCFVDCFFRVSCSYQISFFISSSTSNYYIYSSVYCAKYSLTSSSEIKVGSFWLSKLDAEI